VKRSLRRLNKDYLQEVLGDFVPVRGSEKALVSDSRWVTDYGKILVNKLARDTLRKTTDFELARQVIDQLDLPARVTKEKGRLSILREELARTTMTPELKDKIDELFVEAKQIKALADS
jgi:hypothetical protein